MFRFASYLCAVSASAVVSIAVPARLCTAMAVPAFKRLRAAPPTSVPPAFAAGTMSGSSGGVEVELDPEEIAQIPGVSQSNLCDCVSVTFTEGIMQQVASCGGGDD